MRTMRFKEKLTELCAARGWSKADLRRAVGDISANTVGRWWSGDVKPFGDEAIRLARALGVSLDYLADDALDADPHKSGPEPLPKDVEAVIKVYKALRLTEDEAIRRLSASPEDAIRKAIEEVLGSPAQFQRTRLAAASNALEELHRKAEEKAGDPGADKKRRKPEL